MTLAILALYTVAALALATAYTLTKGRRGAV